MDLGLEYERIGTFSTAAVTPNAPAFLKVASTRQIALAALGTGHENGPHRASFHQLTSHSVSLPTNTALGGNSGMTGVVGSSSHLSFVKGTHDSFPINPDTGLEYTASDLNNMPWPSKRRVIRLRD